MTKRKLIDAMRKAKGWKPLREVWDGLGSEFKGMLGQLFDPAEEALWNRPLPGQGAPFYRFWARRENERTWQVKMFTARHCFIVTAQRPGIHPGDYRVLDEGYLGCIVTCRQPRGGEDWTRGRDLADGRFHSNTWLAIMADIIQRELVATGRPTQ